MEELSDKDFDQIFKNRIKDGYLEFEEESWLKMEKKLRSRDRYVFLRNASIVLLFLSFSLGIYVLSEKILEINQVKITKNSKKNKTSEEPKIEVLAKNKENFTKKTPKRMFTTLKTKRTRGFASRNSSFSVKQKITSSITSPLTTQSKAIDNSSAVAKNSARDTLGVIVLNQVAPQNNPAQQQNDAGALIDVSRGKNMARKGITLSVMFGPDFNSTENAIGGKRGMAVGIGISVPSGKKLSLQSGINYGSKNYEAQGYDYTFNNPSTVNLISGIDASCKVLEIPLRASYKVMDNLKNSIDLNVGLSSYFMLKENYRFIYTEASGRKDRFLEEKNANQHYLNAVDLSATYNIKLRNKKITLGVQPYVKIPISGIGEGNVPLKSSGIALKLNYELIKKK
jgi:hypothetical protein